MITRLVVRTSLPLILAATSAFAGQITFSDSTFTTGWSDTQVSNINLTSSTYSASNPSTGGNGTFYRQEVHTLVQNSSSTLAGFHELALKSTAAYDPSSQGAITSLDFSYDLLLLNNPIAGFVSGPAGYGLGIRQNGKSYRAYFGDIGGGSWTSYSHTGLTSTDFVEVLLSGAYPGLNTASHPDFTATGTNIELGYMVANGISGSFTATTGIDNWSVTITNPTPEPGTFAVLGAGLVALLGIGRIRNAHASKLD